MVGRDEADAKQRSVVGAALWVLDVHMPWQGEVFGKVDEHCLEWLETGMEERMNVVRYVMQVLAAPSLVTEPVLEHCLAEVVELIDARTEH